MISPFRIKINPVINFQIWEFISNAFVMNDNATRCRVMGSRHQVDRVSSSSLSGAPTRADPETSSKRLSCHDTFPMPRIHFPNFSLLFGDKFVAGCTGGGVPLEFSGAVLFEHVRIFCCFSFPPELTCRSNETRPVAQTRTHFPRYPLRPISDWRRLTIPKHNK